MNTFTSLPKQINYWEAFFHPPPPPPSSALHTSFGGGAGGGGLASLPPPLGLDLAVARSVLPSVTVVLEGRSICHRVRLQDHTGYGSLAVALRRMLVADGDGAGAGGGDGIELRDAVPGHVVAYEDMEGDLLLAGDLNWKDFVRVARRIRILPAKSSRRKNADAPITP